MKPNDTKKKHTPDESKKSYEPKKFLFKTFEFKGGHWTFDFKKFCARTEEFKALFPFKNWDLDHLYTQAFKSEGYERDVNFLRYWLDEIVAWEGYSLWNNASNWLQVEFANVAKKVEVNGAEYLVYRKYVLSPNRFKKEKQKAEVKVELDKFFENKMVLEDDITKLSDKFAFETVAQYEAFVEA